MLLDDESEVVLHICFAHTVLTALRTIQSRQALLKYSSRVQNKEAVGNTIWSSKERELGQTYKNTKRNIRVVEEYRQEKEEMSEHGNLKKMSMLKEWIEKLLKEIEME